MRIATLSSASPSRQGVIGFSAAAVLMGTMGVFIEQAGLDSITTVFFRCVFGLATMAAYCGWKGYFRSQRYTARIVGLALLSGLLMVSQWVFFFGALERVGIGVSTVVFHVQPFWVVLLGAAIFREHIGAARISWIALAFIGLAMAAGIGWRTLSANQAYLTGIAFTLIASVLYAGVTLIAKALGGLRPHLLTMIQCAVGVIALPWLVPTAALSHVSLPQYGWLAGLGIVHTGISYALIYGAVPKLRLPVIAVLQFIYPLTAVLVDWLVYDRTLTPVQVAGVALIVVASLGVTLGWRIGGGTLRRIARKVA
ncbi:DMT family transporter [Trinickia diaoshuihuensis]|uniref:DMT family transporter n=1 Tax=Trinickia diaoshuihuensis TaxID=2292265 RepID=UPI000E23932F|nr:DMT family transporter [Trinickia diaoshuihuensis]